MLDGIKKNNPEHIKRGKKWDGLEPDSKKDDKTFCIFQDATFGIRAIVKIIMARLKNDDSFYNLDNIIRKYADYSDGCNIMDFITYMSSSLVLSPDEPINIYDKSIMSSLIKAIILYKNGIQPYDDETIDQGLYLAGIC